MCSYYDLIDAKRGGAMFTRGGAVRVARLCDEDIDELISRVDDIHIDHTDDDEEEDDKKEIKKKGAADMPADDSQFLYGGDGGDGGDGGMVDYIIEEIGDAADVVGDESPYITGAADDMIDAPYMKDGTDGTDSESPYITGAADDADVTDVTDDDVDATGYELPYITGAADDADVTDDDVDATGHELPYITGAADDVDDVGYESPYITGAMDLLTAVIGAADEATSDYESPLVVNVIGAAEPYPAPLGADNVAAAPLRPFVEAYFAEIKHDDPTAAAAAM